ncbi:MAG: tetratricopeptide repeat protein [Pseudomonadota bacterium]
MTESGTCPVIQPRRAVWPRGAVIWAVLLAGIVASSPARPAETFSSAGLENVDVSISELLRRGRAASAEGELDRASVAFEAVLARDPANAEAHFRLGTVQVRAGRYEEGVRHIERSVSLAPDNMSVRFSLASLYEKAGQTDKAEQTYQTIAQSASADDRRKAQEALARLRAAAAGASPPVSELRDEQLDQEAQAVTRRLREAADAAAQQQAIQAALARATQLQQQSQLRYAAALLEAVLKVAPEHVAALTNLGILYDLLGQRDKAETLLRQAADLAPDNALILANLGKLYLDGGKQMLARRTLESVIKLDREPAATSQARQMLVSLYISEGNKSLKLGKINDAVNSYRAALTHDPDNVEILYKLALVEVRRGQRDAALAYLEQARRTAPDQARVHYQLALLYEDLDRFEDAISAYNKALATLKADSDVQSRELELKLSLLTARRTFDQGDLKTAERLLENIIDRYADSDLAYFYLALIYERTGRLDEAVSAYEKVITLTPGHMGARLNLGRLYEQTWSEEEALTQYNIVTRSRLSSGIVQEAERRTASVAKILHGWSYSLSQSLSFDDNVNFSAEAPAHDYRSDFALGLTYQYKFRPDLRLRTTFGSQYSAYVIGGYDLFNIAISPVLTFGTGNRGVEMGYSYNYLTTFLDDSDISASNSVYVEARAPLTAPRFLSIQAGSRAPFKQTWMLRGRLNSRLYESATNHFLNAANYSAQLFLNIKPARSNALTLGYGYTINENKKTEGSDYAYTSHSLNAGWEQNIVGRLSGGLRYNVTLLNYTHPDSISRRGEHRRNLLNSGSLSLNYAYRRNVRFFAGFSASYNQSNLPVGVVLRGLDVLEQSSSLGDYVNRSFTTGVALSF